MHERRAGPRCHRYAGRPRHCGGAELRPKGLYSHASGRDGVHGSGTAEHYRARLCPRLSCHTIHNDCVRVHSVYAGYDYRDTGTRQSSVFSTYDSRRDLDQVDNAQYVIEIFLRLLLGNGIADCSSFLHFCLLYTFIEAVEAANAIQQQNAHQQIIQENEQFALGWVKATFELAPGIRIEQEELYKKYLGCCTKIGRRGVIAPLHFPRCVR